MKCVVCGSGNLYYKADSKTEEMCRNCYNRFRRSGFTSIVAFSKYEREAAEIAVICKKIKKLAEVLKINYSDMAEELGVSREAVRQWFNVRSHVPYEKARDVYQILLRMAEETRKVLDECA